MTIDDPVSGLEPAPKTPGSRSTFAWWLEGIRTGFFMSPKWEGLRTGPFVMLGFVLAAICASLVLERLAIVGPARFYWRAVVSGWIVTLAYAWVCYLVRADDNAGVHADRAPSVSHLFTMILAQSFALTVIVGASFAAMARAKFYSQESLGTAGLWVAWLAPIAWVFLAEFLLIWRGGRRPGATVLAVVVMIGVTAVHYAARPTNFWYPVEQEEADDGEKNSFRLTQEVMEDQPELLKDRLNDIQPQRPGIADVYVITFAPYEQDVFRNESRMVADVMVRRFDAKGRVIQLVNHADTVEEWPWATALNLQRTIAHVGKLMDHDEDILFIHLTSHGAADGEMAAEFWPMEVEPLHPEELKQWLDEAGIRNRVISVSACYSGSWIKPLAGDDTLVLTAADADHTSYGCGSKSELTFFGKAMYDEQLRSKTLSFEEAYKAARTLIEQREKEVGKDDGFSNPQISMGVKIRGRLGSLRKELGQAIDK